MEAGGCGFCRMADGFSDFILVRKKQIPYSDTVRVAQENNENLSTTALQTCPQQGQCPGAGKEHMADLIHPQNTIAVIQKYNFRFQKKYGQNFLTDSHVLDKIIRAADIQKEDYVLEIGPGIGTMTQALCTYAGKVAAVEIDRSLIPILQETLMGYDNVAVLNEDILKLDIKALVQREHDGRPVKIVANLPYYITTPIIMGLLEGRAPIESITVMVQKEVAERMQAAPGGKDYGALSLAVQYYAKPQMIANVPPNCFIPRPSVASSVIRLKCHRTPPVFVRDEKLLFTVIRASFNQRRKTLANGLKNASGLPFSKEQVQNALRALGMPDNIRGEALSLEQFARLSDELAAASE